MPEKLVIENKACDDRTPKLNKVALHDQACALMQITYNLIFIFLESPSF